MANEIKQFYDEYKKCRDLSFKNFKKEDAKQVEALQDRIKYFGYDMRKFLEQLEDVVLEEKAGADPIQASKIEDYAAANKTVRELLKAAHFNRTKVEDACKELNNLQSSANTKPGISKLKKLKKDIETDLKSRDKKDKHRAAIEKLQKDVDADLKILEDYEKSVAKIPKNIKGGNEEFSKAIKDIMNAKPRLSDKTKKFMALVPTMLTKEKLKKTVKKCEDLENELKEAAKTVGIATKENNSKEVIKHVQAGYKHLQKLQGIVKGYTDIEKKYGSYIDKSDDKKVIHDSIKDLKKIIAASEKLWDETKG